jgi:RNA polymerase sigma factor (sigma-70 family)
MTQLDIWNEAAWFATVDQVLENNEIQAMPIEKHALRLKLRNNFRRAQRILTAFDLPSVQQYASQVLQIYRTFGVYVDALKHNNNSAWDTAYKQIELVARSRLYKLGRPELLDDVVNDVYVLLMKAEYPCDVSFNAWLAKIVNNTCSQLSRKFPTNIGEMPDTTRETKTLENAGFEDPQIEFFGRLPSIEMAIRHLHPNYAQLLKMHYFEQMQLQDIATRLNIKPNAIHARHRRAIQSLQNILRKFNYDDFIHPH